MSDSLAAKLHILAASAKYDVSCSSSGAKRKAQTGKTGDVVASGLCHSFTEDGRCISLLKVLLSNVCRYDCAYCINRRSNDIPRAAFTVDELVRLTMEFYRRNYIEGLFLSSAVHGSPDQTMERLVAVAKELRTTQGFNGYIHMKVIPGSDPELIRRAGVYADRLSVNIEIPSEQNLKQLAPEKDHQSVYSPMYTICRETMRNKDERKHLRSAPRFAPAGQSTQMIIGASNERDCDILRLSGLLYRGPGLKRVYYSGYIPVNACDARLPAVHQPPPVVREHRLYQADWLMRLYGFQAEEIAGTDCPDLDLEIDPKLAWALRHPAFFPLDVNTAEYEEIVRVPGIGLNSARRIAAARRHCRLGPEHLRAIGVAMRRAQYFLTWQGHKGQTVQELGPVAVRKKILRPASRKPRQLSLFDLV